MSGKALEDEADTLTPVLVAAPPDSPRKSVKSTAVVKYSAVRTPATFAQLRCNTDLNLPPSNWLSNSVESYGLQSVWSHNTGFSSFRMAHMFPDCVGEVDVVSDAENIKKLLKMPYKHGPVSMMVHRIENTLLLDDFDIHKYLLRQAESDWEWLKKFFYEHVLQNLGDKEKRFFHKASSRNALQQKNLVSKFLYHSLVVEDHHDEAKNEAPTLPVEKLEPRLPEPTLEEKLPDPSSNHNFARNVLWTFENIQMLIGTNMPIFGGQTHPCISLRLRDMTKPINVLTGIDYWLDNLMCNVPEVVMCYHLDGIVQKYELIKTEDLPNLDNSKFSPKVIKDVAQNILSFLKNNATKAGHTYWLFKGKDDDVVKLYDLTSLCSDISDAKGQNPFTVPVAMLLYRVARNMKYSSDYLRHQGTIRVLLQNCIQLLAKEKYPQIITSAHYMLSDLYVPADTDPANPGLADQSDEEDAQSEYSPPEGQSGKEEVSAAIESLTLGHVEDQSDSEETKYKPPPICGTVEDRCRIALEHVSQGLECLKYFPTDDNSDDEQKKAEKKETERKNLQKFDEANQNMAKPFEAIPMPYTSLSSRTVNEESDESCTNSPSHRKKNKQRKNRQKSERKSSKDLTEESSPKALLCKSKVETLPTWQAPQKSDNVSWHTYLKILLYEKACLIFAVLAEDQYSNKNYGASLRYILAVLRCQRILETFCGMKNDKLVSYLLGRAGDSCFMTVQEWSNVERHQRDYEVKNEIEDKIINEVFAIEELDTNDSELLPQHLERLESVLEASHKCYEKALSLEPSDVDKNNLMRRLGNSHNELGILYMNQATARYQEETKNSNNEAVSPSPVVNNLLARSLSHLEAGVKVFEIVRDEANLILLHSNTGRVMRLYAHTHVKQPVLERQYYDKALASYQKALQVLGSRKRNPAVWDTVSWDLSTTLFTMATILVDYPIASNKAKEELEREVADLLQKALKYCDVETPGPRQPIYQYRAAIIQHRLASLYHCVYRELDPDADPNKRKANLQRCKHYYEKASKLFLSLEQPGEFLTVQMEWVALAELQAQTSTSFNGKLKAYQTGLDLILKCRPIIELMHERNKSRDANETEEGEDNRENKGENHPEDEERTAEEKKQAEDENGLVVLLEQTLQFFLRSLTKLCLGKNTGNTKKECDALANVYKQCYSATLRPGTMSGSALTEHIAQLLRKLEGILEKREQA
ncbi:erythroid differentiation-related factor 1 [Orussus abietinus]|uniref:erythroid differentiation-related factor 1 n=1 Tax=Orussus abietinus TaxID=222816 RepID=UPI00062612D8|nr:erythroid differentiation-related factor 1 [Orussus abietinus]XP_012287569.1 erythroid differentiation-related factor 1 [Orussus abietinus]